MPSAKDVRPDTANLKCFVCGDAGTGKSVFASTFPTPGFIFDFDEGIQSYRGKDFDYEQFDRDAKGWVQFEKQITALRKEMDTEPKYKTVIVDSTTAMTDLAMERAMQIDPKRSPTGGPLWNVHYQMVKNLMEGTLRRIIALPCNVVVISHQEIVMNQETGAIVAIEPMLTGNLSKKIPGYFDEVYYATVKTREGKQLYQLQTINKGYLKARSRLRGPEALISEFVPNDYEKIMEEAAKKLK